MSLIQQSKFYTTKVLLSSQNLLNMLFTNNFLTMMLNRSICFHACNLVVVDITPLKPQSSKSTMTSLCSLNLASLQLYCCWTLLLSTVWITPFSSNSCKYISVSLPQLCSGSPLFFLHQCLSLLSKPHALNHADQNRARLKTVPI